MPHKKHTAVYLDSPGGSLAGGMRLGKYFKKNKIKTVIQGYKMCASACALAFLGGTDYKGNKWMSSTTKSLLGFHAFSNADGTKYSKSDDTQQVVAEILKYGKYVNAPIEIIIKTFSTPSSSMYWFGIQEELQFGIKVWDIDNKRFIQNNYNYRPSSYTKSKQVLPTYSTYPLSSADFIRKYFTMLKNVPFRNTWNMLSDSMKSQTSFSKYLTWWGDKVRSIKIMNINSINSNTVQTILKFYKRNGKTLCTKDIFWLIQNGRKWLIDAQNSKTISCK